MQQSCFFSGANASDFLHQRQIARLYHAYGLKVCAIFLTPCCASLTRGYSCISPADYRCARFFLPRAALCLHGVIHVSVLRTTGVRDFSYPVLRFAYMGLFMYQSCGLRVCAIFLYPVLRFAYMGLFMYQSCGLQVCAIFLHPVLRFAYMG